MAVVAATMATAAAHAARTGMICDAKLILVELKSDHSAVGRS
jgi:hypothetical protein